MNERKRRNENQKKRRNENQKEEMKEKSKIFLYISSFFFKKKTKFNSKININVVNPNNEVIMPLA